MQPIFFQRYRIKWEAEVQESLHFVLLRDWLELYTGESRLVDAHREDAAEVLGVRYSAGPSTSYEDELRDATLLHITIKDYLNCSPLSLASELARLAFTSVMAISLAAQKQTQSQDVLKPTDNRNDIPIAVKQFLQNLQNCFSWPSTWGMTFSAPALYTLNIWREKRWKHCLWPLCSSASRDKMMCIMNIDSI